MKTLIKNIKKLITVSKDSKIKKGKEMNKISSINDAWLLIDNKKISDFGSKKDLKKIKKDKIQKTIDAEGGMVLPCWCDSHTHIVYSGSREKEFVDRINGLSYEQIAKNGGGILNSSKKMKNTSEDELFEQSIQRVYEVIKMGTGCLEIKSGYGLDTKQELKMLRIIQKIKKHVKIPIKSTFLGAHAIPTKFISNPDRYVSKIIKEMIPKVAEENLADYIDVFCDKGFFTPKQTEKILSAGLKFGLKPKIHANELAFSGGIQIGVKMGAISVDHLEFTGEKEINCLQKGSTISTLLPSTAFFLGLKYPPARKMIDNNLAISLASDYNPGSSPSGNMEFVISLACLKLKMSPEECINAATINGAHAIELQNKYGSIEKGKIANLIITKNIPSISYIGYSFGNSVIKKVLIDGKIYK